MHAYILWLSVFAYAFHAFEEKALGWLEWGTETFHLDLHWDDFYMANATVVFTALAGAMVGWNMVSFALLVPALMLINGTFFHVLPTIIQRRISPGVFSALLLFWPIGVTSYYVAYHDGVLTWHNGILSFVFGALLMETPFFFKLVKKFMVKQTQQIK